MFVTSCVTYCEANCSLVTFTTPPGGILLDLICLCLPANCMKHTRMKYKQPFQNNGSSLDCIHNSNEIQTYLCEE